MRAALALILALSLSGCSGGGLQLSSLNPLNWFGGGRANVEDGLAPAGGYPQAVDTRPLVAGITSVSAERIPSGILMQVSVSAPRAGWHGVAFVEPVQTASGVIDYEVRLRGASGGAVAVVPTAVFIPNARLAGVGQIRFRSATNVTTYTLTRG